MQADIYLAPNGNPFFFSFTGVSIPMPDNVYFSSNVTDTVLVNPGDLIVVYNSNLAVGYTPGSLLITAQFTPLP